MALAPRTENTTPHSTARERSASVLHAAGVLAELSKEEQQQVAHCATSLADVRAALDNSSGPPLSQFVLDMRRSITC